MSRIEQNVNNSYCQEVCAIKNECTRAKSTAYQFANGYHDTIESAKEYIEREKAAIYSDPNTYREEMCANPGVVLDVIQTIEEKPTIDPKSIDYSLPLEEGIDERIAS